MASESEEEVEITGMRGAATAARASIPAFNLQSLVADDDAGGGASDGDTCPTAPATKAKSKADTRPRTLATRAKSMATAQASAKSAAEASRPTHVPAQEPGEGLPPNFNQSTSSSDEKKVSDGEGTQPMKRPSAKKSEEKKKSKKREEESESEGRERPASHEETDPEGEGGGEEPKKRPAGRPKGSATKHQKKPAAAAAKSSGTRQKKRNKEESNAPDATAEDGPAPADLVCPPESQASSPKRLKRLNAFYNREDTSMWAELVAQAEKGDGPLASEFKALTMRTGSGDSVKEDGYENDTDLDRESSMAEHVDTPERQEVPDRHDDNEDGVILMPGNKKDPMTPMSDTTTVVLGEVGEEASQDEGKPALDDAKPRPIPTPLSNLEKEAEVEAELKEPKSKSKKPAPKAVAKAKSKATKAKAKAKASSKKKASPNVPKAKTSSKAKAKKEDTKKKAPMTLEELEKSLHSAYSCGWKRGKKLLPGENSKWADLGNVAKADRLQQHRDAGESVAISYVWP